MALEKRFRAVSPQLLQSDGGSRGEIVVPDTCLFKVKQQILLNSSGQDALELEVKRINSETEMLVGPRSPGIKDYADVSSYTTADGAFIIANEQVRPSIPFEEFMRAVYDEEPTVALRSVLVDKQGDKYTTKNPLPVQLSDGSINIGTVNGELEVQLSHLDNDPDSGDIHDSVRVGDGTELLAVNPDGSINVNITPTNTALFLVNEYNDVTSVAQDTPTTVTTYTAPVGKAAIYLVRVDASGTNIAEYNLKVNGVTESTKRTYFGGDLNVGFEFGSNSVGLLLNAGDTVAIEVEHSRGSTGDFESSIQVLEVT